MKDLSSSKDYLEFRKNFLDSSESNRDDLLALISECLDYFPKPSKTPYLGTNGDINFSFIEKFENIPSHPQPVSKVLGGAMNFFQRSILWHSPQCLQNITPPPLLGAVAISSIANLYNLNLLWDYVSAGAQEAEQQVARQITKLVGWPDGDGVFTYGGKGCLTYAIRIGLNRCHPNITKEGLGGVSPVVITTKFNHYIIESVCAWLGLGKDACIRVQTNKDETVDFDDFKKVLRSVLLKKRPVAAIIFSGGSTINFNIDRIDKATKVIKQICSEFNLNYKPFVYFDTVVSWPWLFYKNYDFNINEIGIPKNILPRIEKVTNLLQNAEYADAIGIDFHKLGFAPYNNSAFFIKNKIELHSVVSDKSVLRKREAYGNNFSQHHTIEHSRSAAPVVAAWTILQSLGEKGFQMYIAQLMIIGDVFRKILPKYGFELLNPQSLCHASIYYPIPPRGPVSFKKLYGSKSEDLSYTTQYVYELTKYFSNGGNDSHNIVELGFLKSLKKSNSDMDMSALRVYPMSPHSTVAEITLIAKQLGKMKKEFDKKFIFSKLNAPEVIHK